MSLTGAKEMQPEDVCGGSSGGGGGSRRSLAPMWRRSSRLSPSRGERKRERETESVGDAIGACGTRF